MAIKAVIFDLSEIIIELQRVDAPPAFAKASAGAAPHPLLSKERGK